MVECSVIIDVYSSHMVDVAILPNGRWLVESRSDKSIVYGILACNSNCSTGEPCSSNLLPDLKMDSSMKPVYT